MREREWVGCVWWRCSCEHDAPEGAGWHGESAHRREFARERGDARRFGDNVLSLGSA